MGENPDLDYPRVQVTGECCGRGEESYGFGRCVDQYGPCWPEDSAEVQDEGDEVCAESGLDYYCCFRAICYVDIAC